MILALDGPNDEETIMKKILVAVGLFVLGTAPAYGTAAMYHHGHRHRGETPRCYRDDNGCNDNDGTQGGGNGNKGRDGDEQRGDRNCHSFCGNTIIVPTPFGSSTTTTTRPKGAEDEEADSIACLVPVPYHCDPRR
jgi:hypothetical protein